MRRRRPQKPKRKPISYELIPPTSHAGGKMYPMLDEILHEHHDDLHEARIALAWCTSWKPDVDGRVTLGKCKKASDLDRELMAYDFIILLSRAFWEDADVTDAQRRALLDHELCHAAVKCDESGEPLIDERERPVYRIRKHDIEEFESVVRRHGMYKRDLERFAQAIKRGVIDGSFVPCDHCRRESPGWQRVEVDGVTRVLRCTCFTSWMERRQGWLNEEPAATAH